MAAKRGQTDGVLDSQAIDLDDSPVLHNDSGFSKKHGDSGKQWVNAAADIKNLGRYQVMSVLGKGAMGLVYKGLDPAINRLVALKTIRLDFVTDPEEMEELKERLFREAQAAGKLSHPNIVTIYDVGSEGNLQYIAMEYLQGQTLEQLMKRKTKFNYKIVAQIISQMCQALEYAHERGIVHRDIKPANIMILPDYSVKIMDYGIARIDSHSMTKTGIAMGTPNYISPEQLKGQATDRRADLFSLGVVMYEMLLQRRPFKGESITSLIYSILNHDPMKPSEVNPEIPLLFDHVIMRALKKDPSQRYQKATEITTDLQDFVASFSNKSV
jgi:serine/threonine-protein kinase